MDTEKNKLKDLDDLYEPLHQCGKQVYSSCDGMLYPMDLYSMSAIDRSLHNLSAFQLLLENENYICALPILRMQLDTLMRYWAFLLVNDAHEFANEIINGKSIRNIKNKNNEKLTDLYIVKQLKKKDPWIERVYGFCCNYVHFSDAHILSVIENSPKTADGKFRDLHLTIKDKNVPQKHIDEAVDAFKVITNGLIDTIKLWSVKIRERYNEEDLKIKYTAHV